jgi:VWFA-related protein
MRLALGVLTACVLAAALGAQAPAGQQPPAGQSQARFRVEVGFVRVDVYPTADNRAVADLTKDDFEILEDGVPQKVATFEHVAIRPGGVATVTERFDPRTLAESTQAAANPRNRLFVLFLDTYHVTDPSAWHDGRLRNTGDTRSALAPETRMDGPTRIDRALGTFLERTLGPDDLIAAMTPDMDARGLSFVRRPESIEAFLAPVWGRRFSTDTRDPEEERYFVCYPTEDPWHRFDGMAEEMIVRRREEKTLRAMRDLVVRLGDLREERKAILLISEGWVLVRPSTYLARAIQNTPPPAQPGVFVGPDGKLALGERNSTNITWQQCEADRVRLARLDNDRDFRAMLDAANRTNTSFYPVDPRGLAATDTPPDYHERNTPPANMGDPAQVGRPASITDDQKRLEGRIETLETAASATDGMAMVRSNDLVAGLKRVADDLSDYYLLGYYSTNPKPDGKYRKITVRVKRPGVSVRARRGYLAATEAEVAARVRAEAPPDPETEARNNALSLLGAVRADRVLHLAAGCEWHASAGGQPLRPVLWIAAELDEAAARQPEWSDGGETTVTVSSPGGQPMATERATVSKSARAFALRLVNAQLPPGDYLVRAHILGKPNSGADAGEQMRVTIPPMSPGATSGFGQTLLFRRGPFTGLSFQPTADLRFRRAERLRADLPVTGTLESLAARLLDRRGQPLPVPVQVGQREDAGACFATAEVTLAPLAPGDYVLEVSARRGEKVEKSLTAFRIVP